MKIKKRIGPKIVPGGTPDLTMVQKEHEPRTITLCGEISEPYQ